MKTKKQIKNAQASVWCLTALFLFSAAGIQADMFVAEDISVNPGNNQNPCVLYWRGQKGESYSVLMSTNLLSPWEVLNNEPVIADELIEEYPIQAPLLDKAFFRVKRLDTSPPTMVAQVPQDNATSVGLNTPLSARLKDETGIDPSSIRVYALGWEFTTEYPEVEYNDGLVTFELPNSKHWGEYGDEVEVQMTVADHLGNTSDDYGWRFRLVRPETETLGTILGVGGSNTMLKLMAVTSTNVVLDCSDAEIMPAMGQIIASHDAKRPFYRRITGIIDETSEGEVKLSTLGLSLYEVFNKGSFNMEGITEIDTSTGTPMGSVEYDGPATSGIPLDFSGQFEDEILCQTNGVLLTIKEGSWSVESLLRIAGYIDNCTLHEMDFSANESIEGNLIVEAVYEGGISSGENILEDSNMSKTISLIKPKHRLFRAFIGQNVPLWIDITFELPATYHLETEAEGELNAGFQFSRDTVIGAQLREGQWSIGSGDTPLILEGVPVSGATEGNAVLNVALHPKLTIKIFSLVEEIKTYSEAFFNLDGKFKQEPTQYSWVLESGYREDLAVEPLEWIQEGWNGMPFTTVFESRRIIDSDYWPDNETYQGEAPVIIEQPSDVSIGRGDSVTFTVEAEADPFPKYQWYFNDRRIPGETGSTLTVNNIDNYDQGIYSVLVSNPIGKVKSRNAQLHIGEYIEGYVWMPSGTFTMGSPAEEEGHRANESPQTEVDITQGFWISQYEVTQEEYEAVMGENPSQFKEGMNLPVDNISWNDAVAFCNELTARERAAGRLPAGYVYRLPTEAEWEYACRAGTTTRYYFGDDMSGEEIDDHAWYDDNSQQSTHPVGMKEPNAWGLYDMYGNILEWCYDSYGGYPGGRVENPVANTDSSKRMCRGGSWASNALECRSANRGVLNKEYHDYGLGVRPVIAHEITSGDVNIPEQGELWTLPELGSEYLWIPSGTFTMGSSAEEEGHRANESPQTEVEITRGFWMSRYEVTQEEYEAVMGENPSHFVGEFYVPTNMPVDTVSWNDAVAFCNELTARERAGGRLPEGYVYRLPTEAEWEYACRAGTTTRYYFGDDMSGEELDDYAWYDGNSQQRTYPVGMKEPNAWGLYDMYGNILEWCYDDYEEYPGGSVEDLVFEKRSINRMCRGGSWANNSLECRSANRGVLPKSYSDNGLGFRPVLGADYINGD
ncbi:MAG: SUMF1/EgtB/PvdO family nonheme iron enzyme [Verrucomicrobia bacterium]|nr:SUMF1/EgtB/PvdO family nonheme iron enzyme [Verrucomicrobiota bacterium]